jgi:2-polyprenyl-6-methoxyphenol hydroxylase-like FAD-dependent oxidoreductase
MSASWGQPDMAADVLIIGAGIAGLTAAARLQRHGIAVKVAERSRRLRTSTAGIVLHPNALSCLGHLGARLRENGAPIERYVAIDSDGTRACVEWRRVWGECGLPLAIHRRVLAGLMVQAIEPGTIIWSAAPQAARPDPDGVTVTFAGGTTGRYRIVIGADGVRSWLRPQVDARAAVSFSGHTFLRTTVPAGRPLDFDEWRVWRGGGYFFGAMPVGRGRMAVFLQVATPDPVKVEPGEGYGFLRRAAALMPAEVAAIANAMRLDEPLIARPAFSVFARRWVSGRVALIGDAAHSFSPATTQGGGIAVEDAVVLAEEIARLGCEPAALAAYDLRRRGRVEGFGRGARLHVTLMDAMRQGGVRAERRAALTDPALWYRRLYGPLLTSP